MYPLQVRQEFAHLSDGLRPQWQRGTLAAHLKEDLSAERAARESQQVGGRARLKLHGKLNVRVNENLMFFKAKIKSAQNLNFHQFSII